MYAALRNIINNLQKYSTTVTTVKKDVNAVTPLLSKRSLEKTDIHKEIPNSVIGINAATPETIGTDECLKDFDDILEEMNKDVTKGASLDDIDEVLNDMKQEDPKDIVFEVPKFDLAEISGAFEYLKDDDVDINSLISLDDSFVSLSDGLIANIDNVIEQNDVISKSSEDIESENSAKSIPSEHTEIIEQHIHVNSTNTAETSRKHSECIACEELNNKYITAENYRGIENQTTCNEASDVEANTNENGVKTNEHRDKTNEPKEKTNEPKEKTNEGIQNNSLESCQEVNDLTTKDVIFMDDSDDCGYQSSDFEFITEEEAKMDGLIIKSKKNKHKRKADKVNRVTTMEVAVDQFSDSKISPIRKKIKRQMRADVDIDPDWAPESDTDSISDDDFIPDYKFISNNKCIPDPMEYLCGHNTRSKNNKSLAKSPGRNNSVTSRLRQIRIPPKTKNGSPRNLQINSESQSGNITEYNVIMTKSNEERDNPDRNNNQKFSNELASMKMECNSETSILQTYLKTEQLNYLNVNFNQDLPEKEEKNSNKTNPASNFTKKNHSDSNDMIIKTNELQDGFLNSDLDLPENVPESNKIFPGTSLMKDNSPDTNIMVMKTNEMQERPEQNNTGFTLNIPEENNVDPGPNHSQKPDTNILPGTSRENVPDPNTIPGTSRENVPDPNAIPGTSRENVPDPNTIPGTSRENVPDPNTISGTSRENVPDPNTISGTSRENVPDPNTIPGTTRENVPDPNTISGTSRENVPDPNTIPGTSRENVPDPHHLNPGPCGMQINPGLNNFGPGPSCKRNRSPIDEVEKWRMYQMRNRLNRPQFVIDYSYRDHHNIYQGNDLHQLFDPNRAPLPTPRSTRLLENKSTVCKNSMLVEYQGVGFDVPQQRGDSGSEDDEVKQEANESAQKILEMYPGPNTRRPLRRRF